MPCGPQPLVVAVKAGILTFRIYIFSPFPRSTPSWKSCFQKWKLIWKSFTRTENYFEKWFPELKQFSKIIIRRKLDSQNMFPEIFSCNQFESSIYVWRSFFSRNLVFKSFLVPVIDFHINFLFLETWFSKWGWPWAITSI